MATLLYRGRNPYERTDVVTPTGLHLRVHAGDVVEVPDEEVDWLLAYQYGLLFKPTDEEPHKAVDASDVQHAADATIPH